MSKGLKKGVTFSNLFQPIILGIQPLVLCFFLTFKAVILLGCTCCWLMMGCWLIARSLIWGFSGFDGDATTSRAFEDFKVAQIQTWRWNLNSLVGGFKRFFMFTPIRARFPFWRSYVSIGFKPPPSSCWKAPPFSELQGFQVFFSGAKLQEVGLIRPHVHFENDCLFGRWSINVSLNMIFVLEILIYSYRVGMVP